MEGTDNVTKSLRDVQKFEAFEFFPLPSPQISVAVSSVNFNF